MLSEPSSNVNYSNRLKPRTVKDMSILRGCIEVMSIIMLADTGSVTEREPAIDFVGCNVSIKSFGM